MRSPIRTVVLHGDQLLRDEVAGLVADEDIAVVGAVDGVDACADLAPEVVVVAHRLPGTSAIDVCEHLAGNGHGPRLVVLASAPRAVLLRRVVQAGALGFVVADSPPAVLRDAVRWVSSGRPYFDPALGKQVIELVARTPSNSRPYGLTRAQLDVVTLLPKGLPNREIARELGITENTVKTHLRHALRKLNVRDRAQAAALVVREGLA
jgi:DNA-binding NarL/FixJ family response regulator